MILPLQEKVGAGVDEECLADRVADGPDPASLKLERMKAFPANHLVLEIAADRTSLGKARNIAAALLGISLKPLYNKLAKYGIQAVKSARIT